MTPEVRDLAQLIAFPTVSNRPTEALASFTAERLESMGFEVEHFPAAERGKGNLIASIGPRGTDGLVLSGHMDVVPTEGQPWTTDPFVLTEREGRLYGRGTADMKGFLAATLQALSRIAPGTYERELTLVWTHDEEVGCLGSARLVTEFTERPRPLPTQCLIGEPTDFRILRMHPGHVGLEVEIIGMAAHSSRPDLGVNAIEGASEVVRAVSELAYEIQQETTHEHHFERPWTAINVANIHGGAAINIVPDRCVLQIGYRPLPGMEDDALFRRIASRVSSLDHPSIRSCRLLRVTPALLTPADTALAELLRPDAVPGTEAATFATDGGNLARLGMKPLIFGPGSIEVAHKADEYLSVDSLHRAVDMIERVVRARCCA